nr:outer-membrane lipoprotein carrier protein LolA [Jeongeupia sp. USM3]
MLAGDNALDKTYTRNLANRDGLSWVEAVPKSKESTFDSIRLGLKNAQVVAMELQDHFGQTQGDVQRPDAEPEAVGRPVPLHPAEGRRCRRGMTSSPASATSTSRWPRNCAPGCWPTSSASRSCWRPANRWRWPSRRASRIR